MWTRIELMAKPLLAETNEIRRDRSLRRLDCAVILTFALLVLALPGFGQEPVPPAQPVATNHVLELDGGYVELPPNIFNDLTQATVEAWVRWDDFSGEFKRVFNYGDALRDFSITSLINAPSLWFVVGDAQQQLHQILIPNLLRAQQWCHVAAVSGPGGMKLYLNGALAGTTNYTGSFAGLKNGNHFYLGQTVTTSDPPTNFKGAIDEVRVWNVARTGEQIRDTMFQRLTGKEPGLAALWNFENVENGVVKDAGPGAYNGKLIGSAKVIAEDTPASLAPARMSKVLELDGTNSFVELPADAFTNLDEATVEGWVKWESFGSMSRFFDLTLAGHSFSIMNRSTDPMLHVESFRGDELTFMQVPGILSLGRWTHIAAVAGSGGLRLFVDGALVATNASHSQFSTAGLGKSNYLGRSNFKAIYTTDADFHGQMGEVRVWKGARTEAQIRENMFRELTGKEEGLAGLWNFKDGTARDASPAGHDGKLMGRARVVEATLPSANGLAPWSRLLVQVTDDAGTPVQNLAVRAEVNGTEVGHATSDSGGSTALTVWTGASAVDLIASNSIGLGGWQLGVPITSYTERTNAWKIGPMIDLAGRATALDGKTPHAALVVELVQPDEGPVRAEAASERRPEVGGQNSEFRSQNSDQSPPAASAPVSVLQLDGKSYLELPPKIFNGLTQATVEGWVRWDRLVAEGVVTGGDLFDFGSHRGDMWLYPGGRGTSAGGAELDLMARIHPDESPTATYSVRAGDTLRPHEWFHIAFVTGPGGMKLFVNGVLAGTNPYTGSFAAIKTGYWNWLGRDLSPNASPITGQIAGFRVWKVERTAEQIRENMFKELTGSEPGLFGLWNFADPANPGRDASPGAHDGKLIGQALVTNATLPAIVFGKITDAAGSALSKATVEVHQAGQPDRRIAANNAGEYAFTIPRGRRCNLFVTTGTLSAYRLGFEPSGEPRQRLDWTLAETQAENSASRTPHSALAGLPPGKVLACVLTDESGHFDFPNLKPGDYELRAQVPGGRDWLEGGRILFAEANLPEAQRNRLANLDFRIAPFKKGHWTKYTHLDGLPINETGRAFFEADGTAWIDTAFGVAHFNGREFDNLTQESGLPSLDAPLSLYRNSGGTYWIGTVEGLWQYNPLSGKGPVRFVKPGCPSGNVIEITGTSDGAIWWRTRSPEVLVRYDGQHATVWSNFWRNLPFSWGSHYPQRLAADGKRLWVTGTGVGLVRFEGTNQFRLGTDQGLISEDTGPVTRAPDGSIWLAVGTDRIARFDGAHFTYLTRQDGLPEGLITALYAAKDGNLWIGLAHSAQRLTFSGRVARFDGHSFVVFGGSRDSLMRQNDYSAGETFEFQTGPDGALWSFTDNGICRYEPKSFATYTSADGLRPGRVEDLLATGDGSLWLDGSRFYKGRFTDYTGDGLIKGLAELYRVLSATNATANGSALSRIALGPDGCLWLRRPGYIGIERFDGAHFQAPLTNFPGLPTNSISCLARAADGAVWVGTVAGGLGRFSDRRPASRWCAPTGC